MTAFLTTIILLPVICAEYQELKLIRQLNNFYNFDHNVFLLDKSVDANRFINKELRDVTPQTLYIFENIGDNITGLETLKALESKITLLIIVSGDNRFENITNLLNQVKKIQQLQINMKIGIFFPQIDSSVDELWKVFDWSWQNKIINIFAATYSYSEFTECFLNVFTYNPFGTFTVFNITGSVAYENFFISQTTNFKQHTVLLGAPFNYYNNKKLWLTVFRVMNASYKVVQNNYTTISEFFENGIDFVPRIFFNERPKDLNMYPIDMIPMVIMVPESLPYSEFTAYMQTITSDKFFGYSLITIALTMFILSVLRYIKRQKILIFQSVADVLNLLMNDNGSIVYQKLFFIEVCIIVPLTFLGFVIVNGFLSNLTSYLTKPILQPQINTVEDIYRSNISIFLWNVDWKRKITKMLTNQSGHTDWSEKVIVLDGLVLFNQFTNYNRTLSFLEDLNYAKCLLRIQKQLNIKGYYIPNTRTYQYLLSYPVNREFPFTARFNEIASWILNAGLYDLWLREAVSSFEKDVVKKNLELLKDRQEQADIDKFPIPIFIFYGWVASIIVFIIEIIWKKLCK